MYVELVLNRAMKIKEDACRLVQAAVDSANVALASANFEKNDKMLTTVVPGEKLHSFEAVVNALAAHANKLAENAENPVSMSTRLKPPSSIEMRLAYELRRRRRARREKSNSATSPGSKDEGMDDDSMDLKEASLLIKDALTITVVVTESSYTVASTLILENLFLQRNATAGFSLMSSENGWTSPVRFDSAGVSGGIGIKCVVTMAGEDDGVAFTPDDTYPLVLQFHTPTSYMASLSCASAWASYRAANTIGQRKAAIENAARMVALVPSPPGSELALDFFEDAGIGPGAPEELSSDLLPAPLPLNGSFDGAAFALKKK
jgi:hypothetical protein